jgi:hypothetical protein
LKYPENGTIKIYAAQKNIYEKYFQKAGRIFREFAV